MFQKLVIALVGSLLLTLVGPAWACTFCPPDAGPTLLKQLDSANASVLAELVARADSSVEDSRSRYQVVKVLKGSAVKSGDVIDVPLNVQSPIGSTHLFFSGEKAGEWQNPVGVSTKTRGFLSLASELPSLSPQTSLNDRVERLAAILPFLASADRQVALSAHGEFSAAPLAVLKELKLMLDHRQLSRWIQSDLTIPQNRRVLFQLLGICENPHDIFVVIEAMDQRLKSRETTDLDAILTTYLTLRGTVGLNEVERRCLNSEAPLDVKRAFAAALRFHGDQETSISRKRVIGSCRLLLRDPKTADYVIDDLARWNDWESLGEVLKLWETRGRNRWLRYPILEYLKACPLPVDVSQQISESQR